MIRTAFQFLAGTGIFIITTRVGTIYDQWVFVSRPFSCQKTDDNSGALVSKRHSDEGRDRL